MAFTVISGGAIGVDLEAEKLEDTMVWRSKFLFLLVTPEEPPYNP